MRSVYEKVVEEQGRLDICVAAAGILTGSPVVDADLDVFSKVMSVK